MHWPVIQLTTPSYQQGGFLGRAIQSVLDQHYPALHYSVIDGGSTDESLSVIERYRARLDRVVVERDRGQSHAINKGLHAAEGEVLGWLNADDTLLPGALHAVGQLFAEHPRVEWVIGRCVSIDAQDRPIGEQTVMGDMSLPGALLRDEPFNIPQPAVFWRRRLTDAVGLLDESLHHCMDFELWCRFFAIGARPRLIDTALATYRFHGASKSVSQATRFQAALIDIEQRYLPRLAPALRKRLRRKIGYQQRKLVIDRGDPLWPYVLRRPWWLGSQQVRAALAA